MAETLVASGAETRVQRRRVSTGGYVGAAILLAVALLAVAITWLSPYDPVHGTGAGSMVGPSTSHLLGTDFYSRDLFTRIAYGGRVSLGVGMLVTIASLVLGVGIGVVSGYFGGAVDAVISRLTDALMAIPGILLAIAIVAALGPGLVNESIALTFVYLPVMLRVARGATLGISRRMHVRSAHAVGASDARVIVRHILPYIIGPIVVQSAFIFAHAVLYEAALSFLGLGVQPPEPSWGNIINEGMSYMFSDPGYVVYPSIAICITVLAVNLLGDALRDMLEVEGQA